ncbi:MAG: hypothetical protein LBE32_01730 [Burkholderiales bacterium]|nr:hypothetical protein [Burkholderiales bacterium]
MKNAALAVSLGAMLVINCGGCVAESSRRYSLADVQGVWWSDCKNPAAEFVIKNDHYFGDFLGQHKVSIKDNVLTFEGGFVVGHDVNVSGKPLSFIIISARPSELVLRSLANGHDRDWRLHSCE